MYKRFTQFLLSFTISMPSEETMTPSSELDRKTRFWYKFTLTR